MTVFYNQLYKISGNLMGFHEQTRAGSGITLATPLVILYQIAVPFQALCTALSCYIFLF